MENLREPRLVVFNGSKGTVVGFASMGEIQSNLIPISSKFHELIDREIPTIFVKMDLPIGYSMSKTIPDVIPFAAITTDNDIYIKHYHRWQIPGGLGSGVLYYVQKVLM